MTATMRLTAVEGRLFLRDPASLFFTALLPLILLAVNGGNGNEPSDYFGGQRIIDVLVPGYIAMSIATIGLTTLPETLAGYREKGILRRLSATPVPPSSVLIAQALVLLTVGTLSLGALVGLGFVAYGLTAPAAPAMLVLAFVLGSTAMAALGMIIAALLPTSRSANAVGLAVYFPMIFLCGAAFPTQGLPPTLRAVGEWLPLSFVTDALRGAWLGTGVSVGTMAVLAAITVAGGVVAARAFRWE